MIGSNASLRINAAARRRKSGRFPFRALQNTAAAPAREHGTLLHDRNPDPQTSHATTSTQRWHAKLGKDFSRSMRLKRFFSQRFADLARILVQRIGGTGLRTAFWFDQLKTRRKTFIGNISHAARLRCEMPCCRAP
jgi:hypothetical protein